MKKRDKRLKKGSLVYMFFISFLITFIFSVLVFLISIYFHALIIFPAPLVFPEVSMTRNLPSSVRVGNVVKVNLEIYIENISNIESVLIIEQIPDNFELISIKPETILFDKYTRIFVWGKKGYVPISGTKYSYEIKALQEGNAYFEGIVGVVLIDEQEGDFDILGDNFIYVSGVVGADTGNGGGEGGGAGAGEIGIEEKPEKEKSFGEKWRDLDEQEKEEIARKSVNIVLYVLFSLIIIIIIILVIVLIKERKKKKVK